MIFRSVGRVWRPSRRRGSRRARGVRADADPRPRRPACSTPTRTRSASLGLLLLLLPVVPGIGRTINGARLWVQVGPIGFQPSEIGKVLIVVFLASYLDQKRELLRERRPARFGPLACRRPSTSARADRVGRVARRPVPAADLGASLLYFGIFVVMLWVATGRVALPARSGSCCSRSARGLGYQAFDHVQLRVDDLAPRARPGQGVRARVRAARAGAVRDGDGRARRRRARARVRPGSSRSPRPTSSSRRSARSSGCSAPPACCCCTSCSSARGCASALARADGFGRLLAAGLATPVALQTFVIVGGVTRVIPLTGVTLPFVSYGGSSLVSNFVLLALLVRVSSGPAPVRSKGGRRRWSGRSGSSRSRSLALFVVLVRADQLHPGRSPPSGWPTTPRTRSASSSPSTRSTAARSSRPTARRSWPRAARAGAALRYERRYPHGPLYAHLTGYYSFVYGRSRARAGAINDFLAGDAAAAAAADARRPGPRPAEAGRLDRARPSTPTCRRPRRTRSATLPGAVAAIDPRDRRRARARREPHVRPEPALLARPRPIRDAWDAAERRPGQAAALARERRAVPAGLDVQDLVTASAALENGYGPDSRGRTRTSSTSRSPTRRSRTSAA